MADKKISELNSLTGANAADGDLVAIVDVSATETKKITRSEFFTDTPSIDVTGTVTADGLTVDGDGYFGKSATGATTFPLRVQNTSTDIAAGVGIEFSIDGVSDVIGSTIRSDRTGSAYHQSAVTISNRRANGSGLVSGFKLDQNGDISFYEDTGTTPKFFWDASAERLGINVTDPIYPLEVQGQAGIELYNGTGGGGVLNFRPSLGDANKYNLSISSFDHSGGGVGPADGLSLNGFDGVSIATGSSTTRQERMRIDASGNVGIGTSSPAAKLHIEDDAGSAFRVENITNTSFASSLFVDDTGAGLTITNYGSAYASGSLLSVGAGGVALSSTTDMAINVSGAKTLRFGTNSTERMRIDASGNVIIGATSVSNPNGYGAVLNIEGYAPALVLSEDTGRDYTIGVNGNNLNIFNETTNVFTITDSGSVGIATSSPRAILDLEGNAALDTDTATLTTTSQTSIATFAVATFDAAKVVITANNGTDTYITELLVAHDGTTAVATEYGQLSTDTFTVAYDVDISGGNVRILATPPAVTSTTFKVIKTLM
jgi:hypothetical protein